MALFHWRGRGRRKGMFCIGLLCLICLGFYKGWRRIQAMKCSNVESLKILEVLCKEYKNGNLAGNLCSDICDTKSMNFMTCNNYLEGKKIFVATWNGRTVIMKSKKAYYQLYDPISFETEIGLEFPLVKEFVSMVQGSVEFNLNVQVTEKNSDILTRMWSISFEDYLNDNGIPNPHQAAMQSLWCLMQQDEYVMMKFYQHSNILPTIYGTCGHFYVMEYAPPGKYLAPGVSQLLSFGQSTWRERAALALKILDFVKASEHELNETLNYCDVKGENYGISETNQIKAIDVDMAFLTSKLMMELKQPACTTHEECDFFDCRGWCDLDRKKCTTKRINNNLEAICRKVFLSQTHNAYAGLLKEPPLTLKERMETVLHKCLFPKGSDSRDLGLKASKQTFKDLYQILEESLRLR